MGDKQDYKSLADNLISLVGGYENITILTNCMTRLRITVKNEGIVELEKIRATDGVLGLVNAGQNIQIILGIGKVKTVTDICKSKMKQYQANTSADWEDKKQEVKSKHGDNKFKVLIKNIAEIFLPLIPAIIAAGLFAGLGAGFGGAFVMVKNVMAVAWEPSGILGAIVMQPSSIVNYIIGIFIATIGGFVVTFLVMRPGDIKEKG